MLTIFLLIFFLCNPCPCSLYRDRDFLRRPKNSFPQVYFFSLQLGTPIKWGLSTYLSTPVDNFQWKTSFLVENL